MITHIQQSRSSSLSILQYNEEKVEKGLAAPVLIRNTHFDDVPPEESPIASIFSLFEDLESNPAVSRRVRTPSFHMSVNPSDTDGMTQEKALSYIQDVMSMLGYGEQPYIVYRHNDIEREHWHVVSTKIRPDGTTVPSEFEGRRLQVIQKQLAEKYGYTPGLREEDKELQHDDVLDLDGKGYPEFNPKTRNKRKLIRAIFEVALQFVIRSVHEFKCIMASMGVHVDERRRGEKTFFVFSGIDGSGKKKFFYKQSERNDPLKDAVERVQDAIEHSRTVDETQSESATKMRSASDYIASISSSLGEYIKKMRSANLIVDAIRTSGEGLSRLTLVSRRMRTVLDSDAGMIDIEPLREKEASGQWVVPRRGRRSAEQSQREGSELTPEQMKELKRRIAATGRRDGAGNDIKPVKKKSTLRKL